MIGNTYCMASTREKNCLIDYGALILGRVPG